jgi:hypothetical protein
MRRRALIELVFADGPLIHLDVECVEAQLEDLGAAVGNALQAAPSLQTDRAETGRAAFLNASAADFESRFTAFLATKREVSEDVDATVRAILDDVRARGDAASRLHEEIRSTRSSDTPMRVGADEIEAAMAADPSVVEALRLARDRIRSHHERQMPKDDIYTDDIGVNSVRAGRR